MLIIVGIMEIDPMLKSVMAVVSLLLFIVGWISWKGEEGRPE
jgi:hypothetical protein